ncbi:integrase core domain-containing protein [Chryseobacterium sp. Leaf180]|uniref:integrase core domain-containing protein n=1 Tax=Chryseobacterium sp. Leaf180 TaxID=1736289 RepID=UPI0009E907F1
MCLHPAWLTHAECLYRTLQKNLQESYPGCLYFESLDKVRSITEEWIKDYNYERPHDSLNGLAPVLCKKWTEIAD